MQTKVTRFQGFHLESLSVVCVDQYDRHVLAMQGVCVCVFVCVCACVRACVRARVRACV